jgi:hypothetical protein
LVALVKNAKKKTMEKGVIEKLRTLLTAQTKERLVDEILLLCENDKQVETDFKERYFPIPRKPCILSDAQVNEIAEGIDIGNIYYVNLETREVLGMMSDEQLDQYGISFDDDEEDWGINDDSLPEWHREMEREIRDKIKKIESWKSTIIIKAPDSHEAYCFMEQFVTKVIPENKRTYFEDVLSGRKPFAKFNHAIYNSPFREDWFKFKKEMMLEYVKDALIVDDQFEVE